MHQLRSSVLCLVNGARRRRGVRSARYSPALRRAATGLSRAMVAARNFSHYGPGGSTVASRVSRTGYLTDASSFQVAENIGTGRGRADGSAMAVVREWMHSAEHRANILDPGLRDFGVGVARGDPLGAGRNSATYTLDFGARR